VSLCGSKACGLRVWLVCEAQPRLLGARAPQNRASPAAQLAPALATDAGPVKCSARVTNTSQFESSLQTSVPAHSTFRPPGYPHSTGKWSEPSWEISSLGDGVMGLSRAERGEGGPRRTAQLEPVQSGRVGYPDGPASSQGQGTTGDGSQSGWAVDCGLWAVGCGSTIRRARPSLAERGSLARFTPPGPTLERGQLGTIQCSLARPPLSQAKVYLGS